MFPPKSSIRLPDADHGPEAGQRALDRAGPVARNFGTANDHGDAHQERDARSRRSGARRVSCAAELAGVEVDVHERERRPGRAPPGRSSPRRRRRLPPPGPRRSGTPMPLEEAEVHPDAARRARHRQVDELDRRLERRRTAAARAASATAPRTEIPDPMNVSWARISADDDPRQVGLAELVRDRAEPDVGELADDSRRRRRRRRHQESFAADPAQLRELGHLAYPVASAAAGSELLQADLVRACEVAQVRRERGALQVRLDARHGIAASRPSTAVASARSGPTRHGAGDEELGHVDVERRMRSAERRRGEVDEHRPVLDDERRCSG